MPLAAPAKKRLISVHGWSATVLAILLYVVMLTGTVVVLEDEIAYWSGGKAEIETPFKDGFGDVLEHYAAQVPQPLREELIVTGSGPASARLMFHGHIETQEGGHEEFYRVFEVNSTTGHLLSAQAGRAEDIEFQQPHHFLAQFWREMHVRLHVPGALGLYLTGIAGMAMLVMAVTGVLIHRHIIREIFVGGRPGNRLVSYRDRHNLVGVWSLPFAVILSITGTFYSFATSLALPVGAISAFNGDQEAALAAVLRATPPHIEQQSDMADFDQIIERAEKEANAPVELVIAYNWGLANSEIVTRHVLMDRQLLRTQLLFDGNTGALREQVVSIGDQPSFGNALLELMAPLHFGDFAGLPSKIVWVLLGAAMTYTIVSGLQLWLRRRSDDPAWQSGARAMMMTVWGLPLALVASAYGFFLGGLGNAQEALTVCSFLGALTACILWERIARKTPVERLAFRMIQCLGLSLLVLPLVRLQMGGTPWAEAAQAGAGSVLAMDVLCAGLGFSCLAHARSRQQRRNTHEAAAPAE